MTNDNIPFLNLVTVHRELQAELVEVLKAALNTAGFIGGPMVQGFEEDFARFSETRFCVGVGSGTDALRFALIAAGVNPVISFSRFPIPLLLQPKPFPRPALVLALSMLMSECIPLIRKNCANIWKLSVDGMRRKTAPFTRRPVFQSRRWFPYISTVRWPIWMPSLI